MRRLVPLVALALLLGACGPKTHLELGLRSVSITAPRILTPAEELVPEAPVPISFPEIPPLTLPALPKRSAPVAACPRADVFAVPDMPASLKITSPPAPGTFSQNSEGGFITSTGKKGALSGVVATTVSKATRTVARNGQTIDAWTVTHTDPDHHAVWIEAYDLVYPGPTGLATPGLWLVGLAWDDPVRGQVVYQPVGAGLELLPSPVQVATNDVQYVGAATDPVTLTTLSITRNVRQRERIDACGHVIDTFAVDVSGVLTTRQGLRQLTWTQRWATGYGAADVEHTFTLTNPADGATYSRTLRNTAVPKEVESE